MELKKRVEEYNLWCSENNIDAHIDLDFVDEYIKKRSNQKNFKAVLNDNQHIEGIVIELDNKERDLCLLFNTSQKGDWGYKNTPIELKSLGIKDAHGYTHHWLSPSHYISELQVNPSPTD